MFDERSVRGLVAVVTDSTASVPGLSAHAGSAEPDGARNSCLPLIGVVPLRLLAGGLVADDGTAEAADVVEAAARGARLTTARPPPDRFAAAYQAAAGAGARAVVSIHLPEAMSGTIVSAELAAAAAPIPVRVVDGRTIGTGLGLAALEAARMAAAGLGPEEIAVGARGYAERIGSFFALADPDAALAGGRVREGPPEPAVVAPRLVSRPILRIGSGRIEPVERVRTIAAAVGRLADLAAGFAGGSAVDVAVEHTADQGRAAELGERVAATVPGLRRRYLVSPGTAILAHAGRGMLGVTVAPHQG